VSKLLRVPFDELAAGVCPLPGPTARYVTRVHRLVPGDHLLLFDPGTGMEADAELVEGSPPDAWCRVEPPRPSGYRPLPIELIQGLGKADKPDEVIRAATALGAAAVTLAQTERSVVRIAGERAGAKLERYRRIAVEAARQCGRGDVPNLVGPVSLPGALGEARVGLRLMLAPLAPPLFEMLATWRPGEPLTLLVGPEGGFEPSEVSAAHNAGFLPASLGSTTLRSELAAVAALGALVAWIAAADPAQRREIAQLRDP
jgi:16S rRNA (uracil1498-N3)-methyltransferase